MICSNCGTDISEQEAVFCYNCGVRLPSRDTPAREGNGEGDKPTTVRYSRSGRPRNEEHVPSHLVWAILSTIFCCLPTGIVSIVYAAQVSGALVNGDIARARRLSDQAKTWAWVSFGLGIGIMAVFVIFPILGMLSTAY